MVSTQKAIEEWKEILGPKNVRIASAELESAETATYRTSGKVRAILLPANVTQVRRCVLTANRYRIGLYPISKGKNWGYGSRVPVANQSAILDLSRLNRILDHDERFGYVTVQPGVTFRRLFHYLREKKSQLLLNTTGSTSDSSVIGNILERGVGIGSYADRSRNICSFGVVLGNGHYFKSGMGRFPGAATEKLYPYGLGPYVDGLFIQSSLGIVTELTVWLMPCPAYASILHFAVKDPGRFLKMIDILQDSSAKGMLPTTLRFSNDYKNFMMRERYPWEKISGKVRNGRLPVLRKIGILDSLPRWSGFVFLSGESPRLLKEEQRAVLDPVRTVIDSYSVRSCTRKEIFHLMDAYERTGRSPAGNPFPRFVGIPDSGNVLEAYWRKKEIPSGDPDCDRDRCGIIWCAFVIPFSSRDVQKAVGITEATQFRHGFDPAITLHCLGSRAIILVSPIYYDRTAPDSDEKALACHSEIRKKFAASGYFPYRATTLSMAENGATTDPFQAFLNSLKGACDPNGILSAGRYQLATS